MLKYKTMVLALLQERPEMVEHFRKERMLLTILNYYARQLKFAHELWMDYLSQTKPGHPRQIAAEALEIILKNLDDHLPRELPKSEMEFSLEEAVAFINSHTSPD